MNVKKLLPYQEEILQAPYIYKELTYFFLSGGYGCGKTSALVDCLLYAVHLLNGKKDSKGDNPRIILASSTISFMEKTSLMTLEQVLKNTNTKYRWNKKNNIIHIGNVDIIVMPCENPDSIYGIDASCAFWDEMDELPTEVSMEAISALTQRLRQNIEGFRTPFMEIFSTAQGLSGMYNTYVDFKKRQVPFMLIKARTKDNLYLPKEYIQNLYDAMSPARQKAELEGEFVSIDTYNVFAEYKRERHLLDNDFYQHFIDDEEYANTPIYIGQDFNNEKIGNNAVAACVIDKAIVFVKDYNINQISDAPNVFRTDFPTQPIIWIPDTTSKMNIDAVRGLFESGTYRINIVNGKNPPITDRVFACNTLFHLDRMFICPVCEDLERSVLLHKYKIGGIIEKGSKGAPDHKTDCMSYVVSYILRNESCFYDLYRVTFGRKFLFGKEDLEEKVEVGKRY